MDFKGILSTHMDGSVRIWDCERGSELFAFQTGEHPSRYIRALLASKQTISGTIATGTQSAIQSNHIIVTGHGHGLIKMWTIHAPVPKNADVEINTENSAVVPSAASSEIVGQIVMIAKRSKKYGPVHQLAVMEESGAVKVAAAFSKAEKSSAEGEEPASQSEFYLWSLE